MYPTVIPAGFTSKDLLCYYCMNDLAKQAPVEVPQDESSAVPQDESSAVSKNEYNTKEKKNCKVDRNSNENCSLQFEISNMKINGELWDVTYLSLDSQKPFFYEFLVWKKSRFKEANLDFRFWFGTLHDGYKQTENDFDLDDCSIFTFNSQTGTLIIQTKNNNYFEIQLKFQTQALILEQFLSFIDLRRNKNYDNVITEIDGDNKKITNFVLEKNHDNVIREIKLKNNSEKIFLKKNSSKLHEREEILVSFFKSNNAKFDKDFRVITNYEEFRITNLRIINDVWYNPTFFILNLVDDVREDLIFNFTHDEYDDVIASNVKKTREEDIVGGINSRSSYWNLVQNSVDLSHNESKHHASSIEIETGDIIFMSKGKKLWTWENFEDPNGLVGMIKSAKTQFESRDEKIPEPQVSSSDDDPLKILKVRLVKGEITIDEFKELKDIL